LITEPTPKTLINPSQQIGHLGITAIKIVPKAETVMSLDLLMVIRLGLLVPTEALPRFDPEV